MRRGLSRLADVIRLLGAFVIASLLLGLLGAGLAMPAVGATGAAARQGVHLFDSLPGVFTQTPLSQQSRILAADGSVIATPYVENRKIVLLSQVSKIMQQAQIDIEDNRFYSHGGVDLHGIARAVVANATGKNIQGASTLTQQYVKVTLQENAIRNGDSQAALEATSPTLTRKLQQLKYAVILEQTESKNDILQGYLNLVYYGGLAYGVEAAAEHFFGVHASQLNLPQSALLAGLVQSPGTLNPGLNPLAATARRNVVLDTMHRLGHISTAQWRAAKKSRLDLHLTASRSSCAASKYPYFCTYIMAWLREQPALGKTVAERNDTLNREGLTIQTTFDPKIQKVVQDKIDARVPINNSAKIASAATIIQPGTGNVLAMAQDTDYSGKHATQINYNVDSKYGGSTAGFQFGSTAKTYIVVAALQSGMTINSPVQVPALRPSDHKTTFFPSDYKQEKGCPRVVVPYNVGNDEGSTKQRVLPLYEVLGKSINVAFAGLVAKLGMCTVHHVMDIMGLHQYNGKSIEILPPVLTLGADGVSPMTMAASYATIAAGGVYCAPNPILAITTSAKKVLPTPGKQCKQVISPDIAAGTAEVLKHVLTDGTARSVGLIPGHPSAGKTGTTDKNAQVWFDGFTAQFSTAVWVGTPIPRPMYHIRLNGKLVGGDGKVYGATTAGPIWKAITVAISKGLPSKDFGTVTDKIRYGDLLPVPDVRGLSVNSAIAVLTGAGFNTQVAAKVSSSRPSGDVVSSSPGGGSRARTGSDVTLYPSQGFVTQVTPSATPNVTPTHRPPPTPSPTHSPSPTTTASPTSSSSPTSSPTSPTSPGSPTSGPKPTKTKPPRPGG